MAILKRIPDLAMQGYAQFSFFLFQYSRNSGRHSDWQLILEPSRRQTVWSAHLPVAQMPLGFEIQDHYNLHYPFGWAQNQSSIADEIGLLDQGPGAVTFYMQRGTVSMHERAAQVRRLPDVGSVRCLAYKLADPSSWQ